jgi:hypothetical protein
MSEPGRSYLMVGGSGRRWRWIAVALVLCALGTGAFFFWARNVDDVDWPSPIKRLDVESRALRETVVVPTLDTPIPEGKSAVWCSSFQIAWNRLKMDVVGGPVRIANAERITERLNQAEQSEDDLAPGSFYAAAGLSRDGIVEKIRSDMARRFPRTRSPEFGSPTAAVAYGYLRVAVRFHLPFFENDEPLAFTDGKGSRTVVSSFGVRPKDKYAYGELRGQVKVLYRSERENVERPPEEFALELDRESAPYRMVLARAPRKAALADMLAHVQAQIGDNRHPQGLIPNDTVLVPNMHWRIDHHVAELEGADKPLLNPNLKGLYVDRALQTIEFRLDRGGVELASEAPIAVKPIPTHYHFDRPFLIYIEKRGARHPCFAMWVEHAELLAPWRGQPALRHDPSHDKK